MIHLYLLLLFATIFAYIYKVNSIEVPNAKYGFLDRKAYSMTGAGSLLCLCALMIIFAGTRTSYNDTWSYAQAFLNKIPQGLSSIKDVDMDLGANPGFVIYQIIIKTLFGNNRFAFQIVNATVIYISAIKFIKRYSEDFSLSIYLYIAATVYFAAMGATKQVIALSIILWAFPSMVSGQKIKWLLHVLIAMTFHPYAIVFLIVPLLARERIWSRKMMLWMLLIIVVAFSMDWFLNIAIDTVGLIGDTIDSSEVSESSAISVVRMLVYSVVPLISFIQKDKLNNTLSMEKVICFNLSIFSFFFMFLATIRAGNLFGRMAEYFDLFTIAIYPTAIYSFEDSKHMKTLCIILFAIYLWVSFLKFGSSLTADFFNHVSIFAN